MSINLPDELEQALTTQAESLNKSPEEGVFDTSEWANVFIEQMQIQTALITDHHFERAGFIRLLK
ncbi:hypothetical protein H6F89_18600 [Cyanobacteria bacterium FACHB-63]|nr:hypothetical protein [Cyanobacteria bacterium FACHB-63]